MPFVLTVSEVRRAIYLAAGGREFPGPGEASTALLGSLFHETFRLLTGPDHTFNLVRPLEQADRTLPSWESQLIQHAYLWCVGPQLARHQGELHRSSQEVLTHWQAVKHLCRWLCDVLLKQSRPAQSIEELRAFIFADNELDCEAEIDDASWKDTVILQGRVDAVLRQMGTSRLCAVELKLGQTSPEADLAQACLYHLLLSNRKADAQDQDLALWTFQPEPNERVWRASELVEAQSRLKDLIGKLAQVKGHKPKGTPEQPISSVGPRPDGELGRMAKHLVEAFQEFRAPILLEGQPLVSPAFYRFLARPAQRIPAERILSMATNIWPRLRDHGVDELPQISMERGLVTIDVQRPDRQTVYWDPSLLPLSDESTKGVSRFPVGIDIEGSWRWADLSETEDSHFLVAGTTGSGKTEWLKMMAGSLCAANIPETMTLVLIDPKRTAFSSLAASPFLGRPVVYPSDEDILSVLDSLIEEMERRFGLFDGVQDLKQYNATRTSPMPRIVCICDEYADLVLVDSKRGKEIERKIARIGAKGRSAGLHLILATQKPSRDVVKGVIKANLNARIALKVNERIDSRIILDQGGAETLLGRGDLLFKDLGSAVRLQAPLIREQDLKRAARC